VLGGLTGLATGLGYSAGDDELTSPNEEAVCGDPLGGTGAAPAGSVSGAPGAGAAAFDPCQVNSCLLNGVLSCPDVYMALQDVQFMAEHTRREQYTIRVSDTFFTFFSLFGPKTNKQLPSLDETSVKSNVHPRTCNVTPPIRRYLDSNARH